ncbi:MAG: acyltransferase family protein [Syntrophaceae bacterium]|nr:acyltransferase family protein [Syntrophaceae bacterium]
MDKGKIRLPYIDNLRAMIIMIVVLVHTGVTYSNMGSWYYFEKTTLGMGSGIFFGLFLGTMQSFDMSFLFMVAGYFVPGAYDVKGASRFMKERLFRLGIPLVIFMLIIHPVTVKMAYPGIDFIGSYINAIKTLTIFSATGPLWFVLVLLIFSAAYALFRLVSKKGLSVRPLKINSGSVLLLTLVITIPAFLIRTVMPMGSAWMNLQFPYFTGYIVMFIIGVIAKRQELFESVTLRTGMKWLIVFFTAGYAFFGALIMLGGLLSGDISVISGGFRWQSFSYALWESFGCVTISIGLIGIFRNCFNKQNRFMKFLSDNCFGVYVFHTPILVAISVSLKWMVISPFFKFIVVGILAIAASYLFTSLVRRIYFLKRIFT